jgi:hypothetical protein
MKAVKGNKVYEIDESKKNSYVKQGFDIMENGKVIEYGVGKTIPYNDYKKLEDENLDLKKRCRELEKENEDLKLNAMTVEQLKTYAAEMKVDIGKAETKPDIICAIESAQGE